MNYPRPFSGIIVTDIDAIEERGDGHAQ